MVWGSFLILFELISKVWSLVNLSISYGSSLSWLSLRVRRTKLVSSAIQSKDNRLLLKSANCYSFLRFLSSFGTYSKLFQQAFNIYNYRQFPIYLGMKYNLFWDTFSIFNLVSLPISLGSVIMLLPVKSNDFNWLKFYISLGISDILLSKNLSFSIAFILVNTRGNLSNGFLSIIIDLKFNNLSTFNVYAIFDTWLPSIINSHN